MMLAQFSWLFYSAHASAQAQKLGLDDFMLTKEERQPQQPRRIEQPTAVGKRAQAIPTVSPALLGAHFMQRR